MLLPEGLVPRMADAESGFILRPSPKMLVNHHAMAHGIGQGLILAVSRLVQLVDEPLSYVIIGVFLDPPASNEDAKKIISGLELPLNLMNQPFVSGTWGQLPADNPAVPFLDHYIWMLGWNQEPAGELEFVQTMLTATRLRPMVVCEDLDEDDGDVWRLDVFPDMATA